MLACATNISSGGVALVFLANQAPGLLTKLTAPFWFHKVSYRKRMKMASVAMGLACFLVGYGGLFNDEMSSQEEGDHPSANNDNTTTTSHARAQWGMMLELLGVSFTSFQCSLGEASLLALAGKFDSSLLPQLSSSVASLSSSLDSYAAVDNFNNNSVRAQHDDDDDEGHFSQEDYQENNNRHDDEEDEQSAGIMKRSEKQQQRKCITAFASGTGLAGIIGYAYKSLLAELLGWGLSYIVWSAILFAIAYYCIYCKGLYEMEIRLEAAAAVAAAAAQTNRLNDESRNMYSSATEEEGVELHDTTIERQSFLEMVAQPHEDEEEENDSPPFLPTTTTKSVHDMTACERFQTVLSLWPYMIPLFFVYMTEYMMVRG